MSEIKDANIPDEYRTLLVRFGAWRRRVKGRTWSAVCADDWNKWPLEKVEADEDVYQLFYLERTLYKERGEKIDHIVDVSTLTLME